jgi:hypothetical protein
MVPVGTQTLRNKLAWRFMERKLVLEFTKMNGAGNDFIVIDNRFYHFTDVELAGMARRFCPRRTGIGADGVLALSLPADAAHHYRMRYFNADGSRGTMCGNGARCLARFASIGPVSQQTPRFPSGSTFPLRATLPQTSRWPTVRLRVQSITFGPARSMRFASRRPWAPYLSRSEAEQFATTQRSHPLGQT